MYMVRLEKASCCRCIVCADCDTAAVASTASLNAAVIQTLAAMNYPQYAQKVQTWHATLIFYAIIFGGLFVTTYLGRLFPRFEAVVLVLHIVGFFAILITLVYLAPKTDLAGVWQTFNSSGGYSSGGIAFFLGSVNVMYTFMGIDAATHMGESAAAFD
jgi:choline transport protein